MAQVSTLELRLPTDICCPRDLGVRVESSNPRQIVMHPLPGKPPPRPPAYFRGSQENLKLKDQRAGVSFLRPCCRNLHTWEPAGMHPPKMPICHLYQRMPRPYVPYLQRFRPLATRLFVLARRPSRAMAPKTLLTLTTSGASRSAAISETRAWAKLQWPPALESP